MRTDRIILLIDSIINLVLGVLLISFSVNLATLLGVPVTESYFYPNILGGIFIGIALALFIEVIRKKSSATSGLGLFGAICINLCGGTVLLFWLLFGNLNLPIRGEVFLWTLDILLIVLSSIELIVHLKTNH